MPRRPPRTRNSTPSSRLSPATRMGIAWGAGALVVFLAIGLAHLGVDGAGARRSGGVAALVAGPLIVLFGKAAYLLPFSLGIVAFSFFWRTAQRAHVRLAVRSLSAVPLAACLLAGVDITFGHTDTLGGVVGRFFFSYLAQVLGTRLGVVAGLVLAALGTVALFGGKLDARGWLAPMRAWPIWRGLARVFTSAGRWLRAAIARRNTGTGGDPASRTSTDRPHASGVGTSSPFGHRGGVPRAPWAAGREVASDPTDETSYRPLPAPALDEPLPLDLLPDADAANPALDRLNEQLPALQRDIIDVIRRTTGVVLVSSGAGVRVGLNAILFEFAKREGQTVAVSNVERALRDIGVETGRAPVRVDISDAIRIELPLFDEERRFAPIKPLLAETMPVAGQPTSPPSYLIGRCQDGSPFQLEMAEARHVLVGGGTGGGKTVLLHSIIFGVAFRYRPSEVRLALADNKVFEFSQYRGLPHLWQGIVTTPDGFTNLVENLSDELQRRKQETARTGRVEFPIILTIVDEFSGYDSGKLVRLIAEARALNMLFVLATQHPTAEVISTSIKANLVTGIGFRTRDQSSSRLIIGVSDGTALRARGDCLVQAGTLTRVQAGWVTSPRERTPSDVGALMEHLCDAR